MNAADLPRALTISWLQEKYANREITPKDVILEIIKRSEEDADFNVWITPPDMERIQPYLDRINSLDPNLSPLWGIPFAVKDNIDVAGYPTTAACPDYAYTPDKHAVVVERLIAAGAIPVGKTNMDQFATGLVGTRSPYGETHNALRRELISGGSSSGSAVSVARGQVAFALGTDTAGSGRVPAALNRLIGFKPSIGAWPTKGIVPACESLDCVNIFTHNLEDALTVDRIARGKENTDPWSRDFPMPKPKMPSKICLPAQEPEFYGSFAEGYSKAWKKAVEKLETMDIPVEYVDWHLFSEAASLLYDGPWVAERWATLGSFIDAHPGSALPITDQILRTAGKYDAASVFQAIHRLQVYKMATRRLLHDAVLVMPTCGGTWTRKQVRQDPIGTNREMGRYTNHCNLLDLCAVAVPAGDAASDTPFGITMFALAENENLIFGASASFLQSYSPASHVPAKEKIKRCVSEEKKTTLIAVCGLHMRGYSLEKQMHEYGARFVREALTAPKYQLVKLPTVPAKPGLIKQYRGGASVQLEIWEMPLDTFGSFVASVSAPLAIGNVELIDGSEVPGFICEGYAAMTAEDITSSGGWRNNEKN